MPFRDITLTLRRSSVALAVLVTAALGARRLAQAEATGGALSLEGAVERALHAATVRLSSVLSD